MIFITELRFNEDKVNKVVQDFKQIKLVGYQKDAVGRIAMLIKQFLPLSLMAVKGSMWMTIKEWQIKHEITIADLAPMPKEKRMEAITELIMLGKEKMKKMLVDPEGQKELLSEIFDKATQMALKVMAEQE